MIEQANKQGSLEDLVLGGVPERLLGQSDRARIRKAIRQFDRVGLVDEKSGRIQLHLPALRELLSDRELFGNAKELEENVVEGIRRMAKPDDLVETATIARGKRRISWAELSRQLDRVGPDPDASFRGLGLGPDATQKDIEQALRRKFPDLPFDALNSDRFAQTVRSIAGKPGRDARASGAAEISAAVGTLDLASWWSCVQQRFGSWWFWILAGALIAFAAALPNIALGAALAGAWVGFWAVGAMVLCALNSF